MLRAKACLNCASANFKCKFPCIFREMQRDDYNAVKNHLGRDTFKRHIENIENTAADKKDTHWTALVEACKWWRVDPIEGTFGEITLRGNQDKVISSILLQMSKALAATPAAASKCYKRAKVLADELAPHHPVRLTLAVSQSKHYSSLLEYERAIEIAQEAINNVEESQLVGDIKALCRVLGNMVTSWTLAQADDTVDLNED